MEILPPTSASYLSSSSLNWYSEESKSTKWTPAENKAFEKALALFDNDTPDRWHKVAEMVPGKSVVDVIRQYKVLEDDVSNIEAGLIPTPGYATTSPFTLEWGESGRHLDGYKQSFIAATGKRSSSIRPEQERKKGVPWSEEEHKLFLMGLKKYGKGDWRNISRNFVVTRTATQVASHAQKYFIRQLSGGKDKRRASIHDITTVNLNDNQIPSLDSKKTSSPDHSNVISRQQPNPTSMHKMPFQWNHQGNNGAVTNFNMDNGNVFLSSHGVNSYDLKMQGRQDLQRRGGAMHDSYLGCQSMVFQMQ
ncbi:hypothetical protein ACH5RR_020675 [Cinchona calisaya]|uniref:Uncharacterized protein n=1 Tax=Cinchona calisaya TaxID=153742 RepID=A0ABD2ZF78_9GENT